MDAAGPGDNAEKVTSIRFALPSHYGTVRWKLHTEFWQWNL